MQKLSSSSNNNNKLNNVNLCLSLEENKIIIYTNIVEKGKKKRALRKKKQKNPKTKRKTKTIWQVGKRMSNTNRKHIAIRSTL